MQIHAYAEEDFGLVVAFKEGCIGLYEKSAAALCAAGADSAQLAPHKLRRLVVPTDFHLHSPLLVWLEMTRACNLRCRHCFVSADVPGPSELTTEQVVTLLRQLHEQGVFCIVFSGGEPFARHDFPAILAEAAALGFVIAVVTNGFLLTEPVIRRIPKERVRVTISIDNLHFGEGDGDSTARKRSHLLSTLLRLKQEGIACHVAATMTRENLASVRDIFGWLTEHGIGYREIPFSPIGRGALFPELQLQTEDVRAAADLWEMSLRHEHLLQNREPALTFDQFYDFAFSLVHMAKACKGARFLCYVAANGDVYPCTISAGTGSFRIGNVTAGGFRQVWETSARDFRALSQWKCFAGCAQCPLSKRDYFCTNRCPPLSLVYHGLPLICGATAYDKASLAYRTRRLRSLHLSEET